MLSSTFLARFPQFATTDPTLLALALSEADRQISTEYFVGDSDVTDDAHGYLAAHILTVTSKLRGQGVQSVTAGPASVSYFAGFGISDLESTAFGKAFQRLVATRGIGFMVI